jgi:hypothetical protein
MMKRHYARFALLAGALGVATASVAGCSNSGQGPQAIGTPSVPGSSASGPAAATSTAGASSSGVVSSAGASSPQAQAALYAYEGMVNDWVSASFTANFKDPVLGQYASGSALEEIIKELLTEQTKHAVSKGAPVVTDISYGQMIPAANPTQVVINSCLSSSSWLEYKASDGSLYNNVPGGNHKTQVLAMDENGTWKIDQLEISSVGTC